MRVVAHPRQVLDGDPGVRVALDAETVEQPDTGHRELAEPVLAVPVDGDDGLLDGHAGTVLSTGGIPRPADWQACAAAHAARVDVWVRPHLARRGAGRKHPVHDFLFDYYSQRPAALRRWHPGFGVSLEDASEYAGVKGYSRVVPANGTPSTHQKVPNGRDYP